MSGKNSLFIDVAPGKEVAFLISCTFFRGNKVIFHGDTLAQERSYGSTQQKNEQDVVQGRRRQARDQNREEVDPPRYKKQNSALAGIVSRDHSHPNLIARSPYAIQNEHRSTSHPRNRELTMSDIHAL